MKAETIKAIFTNVLFVIGVVLMIFGFTRGSLTVVRLLTFDKYPLESYEETRCELEFQNRFPMPEGSTAVISDEEKQKSLQKCQSVVEHDRQVRKVEDIVTSVSTFISGVSLAFVFKRFILK